MKPQITIPVSLMMLAFILCSNAANAAGKENKKVKTEQKKYKVKDMNSVTDITDNSSKNRSPKPYQKENEKDSFPPKEVGQKKAHSEEDGKHHHFHMHRAKKIKRCAGLICLLAKILLVITHICLLMYAYFSTLAHVVH